MTDDAKEHLDRTIMSSRFRLGQYIDEGYNLWKRKPLSYTAILILIAFGSSLFGSIPIIGPMIYSLIVSPCLTLGVYTGSKIISEDEEYFRFEDFFTGFGSWSKILVLYLIIFGIAFFLFIPIMFQIGLSNVALMTQNDLTTFPYDSITGTTALLIIPLIYAGLLTSYALPMLGIYQLEPWEALRYSAKYIHKHWVMYFSYCVVILFIVLLGLLAFFVGAIVTASMIYPMIYVSFADVTNLEGYLNETNEEPDDYTGATLDDFR